MQSIDSSESSNSANSSILADDILGLVDLKRYPIHDPDGAGREFVTDCQQSMAKNGWCSLDEFIQPEGIELLRQEANALLPDASPLTISRNIYGQAPDPLLPKHHPGRREYIHHALQLANDQIADDSLTKQLYRSECLTRFIGQVQGKDKLYRSADEFQAANIVALPPGSWQGWHYDHDECVVTLLLQSAESGGEFVFIPNCRTRETEDMNLVEQFLDGDMTVAKTFARNAGTLTMFRGEFSLHGVTQIEGNKPRITAIFTYDEIPDRKARNDINIRIYGPRVERILSQRK